MRRGNEQPASEQRHVFRTEGGLRLLSDNNFKDNLIGYGMHILHIIKRDRKVMQQLR